MSSHDVRLIDEDGREVETGGVGEVVGRSAGMMAGYHNQPGINAVAYVTNAVDSTTDGVDVTARYRHELGGWGSMTATLAANFNSTKFDRIAGTPPQLAALGITAPLFDLTQQVRTRSATPRSASTSSLALVVTRAARRLSAAALPRPSATLSAKLANSTVAHSQRGSFSFPAFGNPLAAKDFRQRRLLDECRGSYRVLPSRS